MSDSLSREQLLDYIKKQKIKIKKLETQNVELTSALELSKSSAPNSNSSHNNTDDKDHELDECYEKISALEEQLDAKSRELQEARNSTKNKIKLLENEISSKAEEIECLTNKVNENGETLTEFLKTIELLKEGFNEKTRAYEEQVELVSSLQYELVKANEGLSIAKQELATSSSSSQSTGSTEAVPCSQCLVHAESLLKSEQLISKYKGMIKSKMKEIDGQKQQLIEKDDKIESLLKEASGCLTSTDIDVAAVCDQHLVTISELQEQLKELNLKLKNSLISNAVATVSEEVLLLKSEAEELKMTINNLKKQLSNLDDEKRNSEEGLKRELLSAASRERELLGVVEGLNASIAAAGGDHCALQQQLSADIENLSRSGTELKEEVSRLLIQIQSSALERDEMLSKQTADAIELKDLQEKLSELCRAEVVVQRDLEVYKAKLEQADLDGASKQREIEMLAETLKDRDTKWSELVDKNKSAQLGLEEARGELVELRPLRGLSEDLRAEIIRLRSEMEALEAASKEDNNVSSPTISKSDDIAISETKVASESNSKKSKKRNKNKSATSSSSTPQQVSAVDRQSQQTINVAREDISLQLEQVVKTLSDEREGLRGDIASLQEQVAEASLKHSSALSDLEALGDKKDSEISLLRHQSGELLKQKEELVEQMLRLQSEVISQRSDYEKMCQKNSDLEVSTAAAETRALELQRTTDELTRTLLSASAERQDVVNDELVLLTNTIRALESRLEENSKIHDVEKRELTEQLEAEAVKVAALSLKVQELSLGLENQNKLLIQFESEALAKAQAIEALKLHLAARESEVEDAKSEIIALKNTQVQSDEEMTEKLKVASEAVVGAEADKGLLLTRLEALAAASVAQEQASSSKILVLEEEVAGLREEVAGLREEVDRARSEASRPPVAVTCAHCVKLNEDMQFKEQEIRKSEQTLTKYKNMVKTKMKEINDLTDELKVTQTKVAAAEEAGRVLEVAAREDEARRGGECRGLRDEVTRLTDEVSKCLSSIAESESIIEELKRDCRSFEQINASLKSQLEQEVQRNNQQSENDLIAFKSEISDMQRINSDLLRKREESTAQADLAIAELRDELDAEKKEVQSLRSAMKVVQENFTAKIEKEQADTLAEQQALNAKIKRLKSLLTKSDAINKEKETEIALMKRAEKMEDKWSSFKVVMRVEDPLNSSGLPRYSTAHEEACEIWCLIVNGNPESKTENQICQSKWILENQISNYMQTNSQVLVGNVPDQTLQQGHMKELEELRIEHNKNADLLRSEIATVTHNFQAYKTKAHTALKRIGKDDHDERIRQRQAEDGEISRLKDEITLLHNQIDAFSATVASNQESLSSLKANNDKLTDLLNVSEEKVMMNIGKIEDLENSLHRANESRDALEKTSGELRTEKQELLHQVEVLGKQLAADKLIKYSDITDEVSSSSPPNPLSTSVKLARSNSNYTSSKQRVKPSHLMSKTETDEDHGDNLDRLSSIDSQERVDLKNEGDARREEIINFNLNEVGTLSRSKSPPFQPSNLIAVNEAARYNQETIYQLREDLSAAILERSDLQNLIAFNAEQMEALKTTIRELEASLARELEFNESNRKLNKEYLVNILRNFLLTKEPSEHAKLVPVLCSILHFLPEDTKIICEKWALVQPRGLLGWFAGGGDSGGVNNKKVINDGNAAVMDAYKVGSGGLDIY